MRFESEPSSILITGSANPELARKVASSLNEQVYYAVGRFSDGEIKVEIPQNVRGREVFIIQPTAPPVNDNLFEIFAMADAAKRASSARISAIIPYFGYARQDRKPKSRTPITAKLAADLLTTSGINNILTMDIHSEQQEGFFNGPWDNIYGSKALIPEIAKRDIPDLVIASPDKSGTDRALAFKRRLSAQGIAMVWKERDQDVPNKSKALDMIGDVDGKHVLIVDDILDTAGSLVGAAELIEQRGAKSIRAAITHGLFTGPALERINNSNIIELFVTDSVTLSTEVINHPRIQVVTVAGLLATAIECIRSGRSISEALFV